MADIITDEEIEVILPKPEPLYDELQKVYDEPLDYSQMLFPHYASLKKSFEKLSLEFKNLESKNGKLWHEKDMLSKENTLLHKHVDALKAEVSDYIQKTSSKVSELHKIVKLLKSNLKKIINGSKNLDLMLGSQRPYFEKLGLGYEKEENEKLSKSS